MSPTLLERDHELERIDRLIGDLADGAGRAVVIEAAAGMGKTTLLAVARTKAADAELRVLHARGAQTERDWAYGVVRQLFEPPLVAAEARTRKLLLEGAAALAAAVVIPVPRTGNADDAGLADPSFAVLHGLYWLAANLAQTRPLLLIVDDAHWSDHASLRYLGYVTRRLEGLGIGLLVATRRAETAGAETLLADLIADPVTETIRLGSLSATAVAHVIGAGLGRICDPAFAAACHDVTAGTPFLVSELVRSLREQAIDPDAAAAGSVRRLAPKRVAQHFLVRLARLSPAAVALARVAAVLGPGADLRHAAAIAGLPVDEASSAADTLAAAGILVDARPLSFIHPIVSTAMTAALPAGERARVHAAAARRFAEEPGGGERAAAHLLAAEPAGEPWVIDLLLEQAGRAVARGAPDSAVAYLRRALAEPPCGAARAEVLAALGFAESYAGDPAAVDHLRQAVELFARTDRRVAATLALGRILQLTGRHRDAMEVFDRGVRAVAGHDEQAELVLRGALIGAGQMQAETADDAWDHAQRLRRRVDADLQAPPSVFGALAIASLAAVEPAEVTAALAHRAFTQGSRLLPENPDRPPFFYHACAALLFAERYADTQRLLDDALADAEKLGSLQHVVALSAFRALLHQRTGRLADAEVDARHALSTGTPPAFFRALAVSPLVEVLLERGDVDAARAALAAAGFESDAGSSIFSGFVLLARGRLHLAHERTEEAFADLLAAGALQRRLRADSPAEVAWRADAARAALKLGRTREAAQLASAELDLARRIAAPAVVGRALHTSGLVAGGEQGLSMLTEAVAALARSGARLEHARALTDLGAALRRSGQRAAAREPLRRGMDLAHRCGARVLAERARTELLASGARPRRLAVSGVDALTASERRVALMAAQGLTNREIAQALFVTARTVEGHLTHAFQKLGVTSRTQLCALVGDQQEPAAP